jgi:NADH:ubiquinone reductase (H+-translocating)
VKSGRILIVGGGYVGMYTALGLLKRVRQGLLDITLVAPESFMVYQPFLPEAASGALEPRHVVIPLRRVLKGARVVTGWLDSVDHPARRATVRPAEGEPIEIRYDHVVIGLGAVSRVLPVPGLAERAVGFTTVPEAIYLRNRVLDRMDLAESTDDPDVRRRALTFVFVGGGYSGVQGMAELEDLARDACRYYRKVRREDMRWVLVEAAPSILPEIGEELAGYAIERLRARDIDIHLATRLESAEGGRMALSDGAEFEADTLVWTAGVRAAPVVERLGFPTGDRGRLVVDRYLRVESADGAWAAGDCAEVPDLVTGGICPPTAQHALRQARRLAKNIIRALDGREPKPFRYRQLGSLVSLGKYKGVARILGTKVRGFPAWFVHRTYHALLVPTINRRARIISDWTLGLFFRRDVVQLGSLQRPRQAFEQAAGGGSPNSRVSPPR